MSFPAAAQTAAKKTPAKKTAVSPAKDGLSGAKGIVIAEEEATVFNAPDFDSQVIATLRPGGVYDISTGKRGPFYKIRLKPGFIGWISDADLRPLTSGAAHRIAEMERNAKNPKSPKSPKDPDSLKEETPPEKKTFKSVHRTRYGGLGLESMNFTEDTMGRVRQENMWLLGARFSGPNVAIAGDMYTDAEILFRSGAPKYYEESTGNPAGGFILLGNFLFIMDIPQTPTVMAFYGFGPTFRLSHFEVTLNQGAVKRAYALDDMTLGAVFNAGVAFALGRYAVRLDGRYYWETQRYTSFGLAFQREF